MLLQRRGEFPALPSYTRFVELIPMTLLPLCAYLQTRKGPITGLQFIDSLPIRVCLRRQTEKRTPYDKQLTLTVDRGVLPGRNFGLR